MSVPGMERLNAGTREAAYTLSVSSSGGKARGLDRGPSGGGERREREHERRHCETMDAMADQRRESQERHREAMETIAGQRDTLEALIE